jgi:hypothetical protein
MATQRLDYGPSRLTPWIVRAEQGLRLLGRDLKNWKRIIADLACLLIVLAAVLVLLVAWVTWLQGPRKIADIPGPTPTDRPLELWYGNHGNLELSRWGGPSVTVADYYGDVSVANVRWPASDRVVLTMGDGSTLEFAVGWRFTPPATQRTP